MLPQVRWQPNIRWQHNQDHSSPRDWYHVPGKENPADEASRSLTTKELLQSDRWFTGPKFLWQQDPLPQQSQPVCTLLPSDTEVRKDSASTFMTEINEVKIRPVSPGILALQRFTSLRLTALNDALLAYRERLKRHVRRSNTTGVHKKDPHW